MSDVMTWNWHGNASGMPLGRNGNNMVVSLPVYNPDPIEPIEPDYQEPVTAPDVDDPAQDPNDGSNYTP